MYCLHIQVSYYVLPTGELQCIAYRWDPAIVNDEDEIANTPLHYAAQAGHVKTVIFLTEESADVDAKNQVQLNLNCPFNFMLYISTSPNS